MIGEVILITDELQVMYAIAQWIVRETDQQVLQVQIYVKKIA
jgi:hypothetical protein